MSELEELPEGVDLSRGESGLAAAAQELRAMPAGPAAVEIADRVLERALAAPRRSVLIRAATPHDHLRVSSIALMALTRQRLDESLVGAAVRRVVLDVDREDLLEAVTVDLVVKYGTAIPAIGEQARELTKQVLHETLGRPAPGGEASISVSHVHVSDVTIGDPQLVDPLDERL